MKSTLFKTVMLLICLPGVTATILIAGLWPFEFFPINQSVYNRTTGYLECNRFSAARYPLSMSKTLGDTGQLLAVSATLDFQSGFRYPYFSRILSFYDPRTECEVIAVGQWQTALIVRILKRSDARGAPILAEQSADSFFVKKQFGTIVVKIDHANVIVVCNADTLRFANLILPESLTLVLGNSPWGDSPWSGNLLLRIKQGDSNFGHAKTDLSGTIPNLVLPHYFEPVAQMVLKPIWQDFTLIRWYVRDVILNIAGFVPFGFLLTMLVYRQFKCSMVKSVLTGIAIGLLISLLIELLQVFLPYRSSQMSDLLFNTFGTAVGALLLVLWNRVHRKSKPV